MPPQPDLSAAQRAFLEQARRAVLATISPDGRPRLVPICYSLDPSAAVLYTPVDDKPKREADPMALARVRDIAADPRVTVLVDRWDEDWTRLAWLRLDGRAALLTVEGAEGAEHGQGAGERVAAVAALRSRYPQYEVHRLEMRPLIRIAIERVTGWGNLLDEPGAASR